MRVIIAGGRDITDDRRVRLAIELSGWRITEVVSGAASGVDARGERWAREHGVSLTRFPADWSRYGPAAGPIRNSNMAAYAAESLPEAGLLLVWSGTSRGSLGMRTLAIEAKLPVFEDRDGFYYRDDALEVGFA